MPWKDEEIQSLIEQINAGVPYRNLKIPGKTLPAIGQQRIRLCRRGILNWSVIPPKATWTTREIGLLIQQVNQGKHLGQIVILGKTQHAISEQRKRQIKLGTCTFRSARPSKSSRRPWTTKEVKQLRHLTIAEGQTAQNHLRQQDISWPVERCNQQAHYPLGVRSPPAHQTIPRGDSTTKRNP